MTGSRQWGAWPICVSCGRRRQTLCPSCGMAGTRFPLAEYLAAGEPSRVSRRQQAESCDTSDATEPAAGEGIAMPQGQIVRLVCPQCDEVFGPQFYRICPACGDDAGSGVESQRGGSESPSRRVLLVLYGLISLGISMWLYFWWLFGDR